MRILLAQNSLYYPAHGGGDKSNRLLIEALVARGHECVVVARIGAMGEAEQARYLEELAARGVRPGSVADGVVRFERAGVNVEVVTNANLRAQFASRVEGFRPETILGVDGRPRAIATRSGAALRKRASGVPGARHAGGTVRTGLRVSQRREDGADSRGGSGGGGEPVRCRLLPALCGNRCGPRPDFAPGARGVAAAWRVRERIRDAGESLRRERDFDFRGTRGWFSARGVRGGAHVGGQSARI